jgi:hypothetical protein
MGNKNATTTQNTTTAPDPQAYAAYQQLLQRAQGVASTPYQAYGGELVAGINPQQMQGIGGINQYAQAAQPDIGQAIGQATSSSAPLSAAGIQQYMSPYTQSVVNATQAQFNNQNAQQQQQVTGNAIAQGALGGNRSGIAAAELANQQNLAQAPVIAGLYNQGYGQAVNTAEQQQQLGLQGAGMIGNLGVAGQTAALQGAGAQLGAGTLQQNTQQMLDQAQMQQFAQQQAFPYQQTQWLAGLDTGVGSQMGGTSNGQTTGPAPNTFSSIMGGIGAGVGALGATGAFGSAGWLSSALPMLAMSDRRVKENIRSIGKTHDGQTIYRFNYKGNPQTHIGFLAQEVEEKHPEAVHEINGLKAVDYKAATDNSIKRASGGAIPGFAVGGVPGMPYAGLGSTYIPTNSIVHGSGPPRAQAPQVQNPQAQTQKDMQSISDMAKTIMGKNDNSAPGVNADGSIIGAAGPTSVGGAPLVGVARGGVVGYDSGGSPTFDDSGFPTDDAHVQGLDALRAAMPGAGYGSDADRARGLDDLREGMQKQYGVNPNDSIRLDPVADQRWRDSTPMGVGEPNPGQPILDDQSAPTGNRSVAHGVAAPSSALAFSGNADNSEMPSEVALGYSKSGNQQGVAPPSTAPSSGGINWGADSKLWPALMSAGFGMMASRSPYLGVAIGEGGQAGVAQYGAEQTRDFEANKFAQQQAMQKAQEARLEQAQRISSANQPITLDSNGVPHLNAEYIKAKQQLERDWQPKVTNVGTNMRGDPVQGIWDPNKQKAFDLQGHPIVVGPTGAIIPWGQPGNNGQPATTTPAATTSPGATTPSSTESSAAPQMPVNPNTASVQAPVKVASIDPNFVPATPLAQVQRQAGYQTVSQAEPHDYNPTAPEGTEDSRNTKFLNGVAQQDPGYALAVQKAANYELDPGKYASMRRDKREHFINDVLQYDPNYKPMEVGLRYQAQRAFLPGTKTGDTIGSFNTAISHMDVLKELYHNLNNPDQRILAKIKNDWNTYWRGEPMPNTVAGIAQMVSGEIVKATVGAQNALGDREEAAKTVNRDLSTMQADDVIDKYQRLMGGKLETAKFQYEHSTGLKNFDDKFLLPRSQQVLKQVQTENGGAHTLSEQDKSALDWANANPKDPRAEQIKKKLGM